MGKKKRQANWLAPFVSMLGHTINVRLSAIVGNSLFLYGNVQFFAGDCHCIFFRYHLTLNGQFVGNIGQANRSARLDIYFHNVAGRVGADRNLFCFVLHNASTVSATPKKSNEKKEKTPSLSTRGGFAFCCAIV